MSSYEEGEETRRRAAAGDFFAPGPFNKWQDGVHEYYREQAWIKQCQENNNDSPHREPVDPAKGWTLLGVCAGAIFLLVVFLMLTQKHY